MNLKNLTLEQFYQEIGRLALELTVNLQGKLIVYAEAEEGVVSADIFYLDSNESVIYKHSSKILRDLFYCLWERWPELVGSAPWCALLYNIEGGKFSIDLVYEDRFSRSSTVRERRAAVVKQAFGEVKVDYSKPA